VCVFSAEVDTLHDKLYANSGWYAVSIGWKLLQHIPKLYNA